MVLVKGKQKRAELDGAISAQFGISPSLLVLKRVSVFSLVSRKDRVVQAI